MKKEERNDKSIVEIKLAFLGATKNLYLLENALINIENLPLYQYSNYLSQIALCIELGMKSIIINNKDFLHCHDLKILFEQTHSEFQKKIMAKNNNFNQNIEDIRNIFKDFRYMKTDSTLKQYLDKIIINNDKTINIKEAINLDSYKFLRLLLDEIVEFEECKRKETLENFGNIDIQDCDYVIEQFVKKIKDK
jgi:hypothetical protein